MPLTKSQPWTWTDISLWTKRCAASGTPFGDVSIWNNGDFLIYTHVYWARILGLRKQLSHNKNSVCHKIIPTYTYICHLAYTHPNSTKKFAMEGKNENLCPHWNTQYFAAASNEFQFPSPEVKTWIINEWCIWSGRSAKSEVRSRLLTLPNRTKYVISLIIHVVIPGLGN